ncbi:MAG TPA: hypothetical protein ENI73_04230 [Spirochaetes bacterium]|nr:hypothetical protein [Spirochaetota bacterium]
MEGIHLLLQDRTMKQKEWKISFYPEYINIESLSDSKEFKIDRNDASEKMEIIDIFPFPKQLIIRLEKKVPFYLNKVNHKKIKEWFGKKPILNDMFFALKRRFKWVILLGIFIFLSSLPIPADTELALEALPIDIFGIFLGLTLVILGIISKIWKVYLLFLLDSLWLFLVSMKLLYDVSNGYSIYWLILLIILIPFALKGFSEYKFYKQI